MHWTGHGDARWSPRLSRCARRPHGRPVPDQHRCSLHAEGGERAMRRHRSRNLSDWTVIARSAARRSLFCTRHRACAASDERAFGAT